MKTEQKIRKNEAIVNGVVWTVDSIRELLLKNDAAVIKGMLRIFEYQTLTEQANETTIENNMVGFSGAHAEIMSSFAKNYQKFGFLSIKQMVVARKIMLRYSRQLIRIIRGDQ